MAKLQILRQSNSANDGQTDRTIGDIMTASNLTLTAFLLGLFICIFTGTPLVAALLFGLFCFVTYARYQKMPFARIGRLLIEGVLQAKNILMIFVLIGMLTALWRACGTIPFIVYHGFQLVSPQFFVLSAFLLCCVVSFLTGTAFGTASTAGVICMMLARLNGIHPLLTAGAILSGIFFGDRCSPMSSSASLVCTLTGTNLYDNIRRMMKTAAVPFVMTVLLYLILGRGDFMLGENNTLIEEFPRLFHLTWPTVLPAAVILLLSLVRLDVKLIMSISIVISFFLCVTVQGIPAADTVRLLFSGYHPTGDSQLLPLVSGGGIGSMVNVGLIVMISSSYFRLLAETGLLNQIQDFITGLSEKFGRMPSMILASFLTGAFSCNQSLATMLTVQLCQKTYENPSDLAIDMEDSVILLAALIPWSIAGGAPLASIGAGYGALPLAFYLYLVPLFRVAAEHIPSLKKHLSI